MRIEVAFLSHDRVLKIELPPDHHGHVIDLDGDGDALINFPSLSRQLHDTECWVQATNFKNLSRVRRVEQQEGGKAGQT